MPKEALLDGGAHCHHLAKTTEPTMCGANAACCQITLTICYNLESSDTNATYPISSHL